ncbi:hypothetical protein PL81_07100 [Streptomyces sp. RSD-27]|nr:hypothetical protein PL81_07100 [Streptomyces sp. RSD-27]
MTATSTDESSAGWRFIAVDPGCLDTHRAIEGGAEGVDDGSLEAGSDVGVDGGGDAYMGVPEKFLSLRQARRAARSAPRLVE